MGKELVNCVEMRPGIVIMAFNRAHTFKGKGDDLKQAKRLVKAIDNLDGWERDKEMGTIGFPKAKPKGKILVPISKKTRIWFWDLVKEDLKNARSIAEEETIREVAVALGKLEEFETLVEDSEPDDDEEEENAGSDGDPAGAEEDPAGD